MNDDSWYYLDDGKVSQAYWDFVAKHGGHHVKIICLMMVNAIVAFGIAAYVTRIRMGCPVLRVIMRERRADHNQNPSNPWDRGELDPRPRAIEVAAW